MLLLAAGRGSRFGGPTPKVFVELAGKPLLVHSAERLREVLAPASPQQVVVAVNREDRDRHLEGCLPALRRLFGDRLQVVDGGSSRQDSMHRCLAVVEDAELVLVHDAARALLPVAATRQCIEAAARTGAALLAIPAADTLKRVINGKVAATVDRTDMWLAQTPQVVRLELLRRALELAAATGFVGTDEMSLVENLGAPVAVVPGSPTNLKITTREDLPLAAALLAALS
jgi:2-C-methyl-D-erythritol 4-phosphate cytidylyltransferase